MMKWLSILLLVMVGTAWTPGPEAQITGTWLMHQVIQDGRDVSSVHNPHHERYIIFRADSTFESGGRPFDINKGSYTYNSADHTLFLDSDAGPEDDSHWKVSVKGDTMHWQGYGSEWALGFQLIHLRKR
jgi:hypothetical protein